MIAFTAACPYCRASLPEWKHLTDSLRRSAAGPVDVVWLSLSARDSTVWYIQEHGIDGVVAFPTTRKMPFVHRVKAVPLTLVYDHVGRVTHARPLALELRASTDSVISAALSAARSSQTDAQASDGGER